MVVHTEHGRPDPVPFADRLIDNRASRWTDVIIAVSEALAEVLRRQVVHDTSRIRVIPNGVDVGGLPPGRVRRAPRRARHARRDPSHRQHRAPGTGQELPTGPPGVRPAGRRHLARRRSWCWRETAASARSLETLASELGIASRVKFLGWRNDADRLYGAFDLFTLTSRSEGTSISLLEAMSAGVCPIVTDVGGNRAVLGPGLESLLVPGDDAEALAIAWQRQLADPVRRAALGIKARRRVEAEFSLVGMVEQHASLYRELLATPRGRARAT